MAMYQFMIATQFTQSKGLNMLCDDSGNPTAHLLGLFNRTIQFLEHGIRPAWVFDGRSATEKEAQLMESRLTGASAKRRVFKIKKKGNV